MRAKRLFGRILAMTALIAGAQHAHAIGDSGGCAFDFRYARILSFGSVADVESYISSLLSRDVERLELSRRIRFKANPALLSAWQQESRLKMLREQMWCSIDFPLDYALGHGNLDVVRWLLDSGVDPNATSADGQRNVFTRCPSAGYGSVAISKQQAVERQMEAYRLAIARGANVNALDPFHAIFGCLNGEMLPLLKQLGARVTTEAFISRVRAARSAGGPIQEMRWAQVEQLAKWQTFDLRGTSHEAGLLSMLDARSNMSDYDAVVELTRRLATVARLSPGIVPGRPARPEDVPVNFAATRERCFFPEIGAYPNFEFLALWLEASPASPSWSSPDITYVKVGRTKAPVLLALVNSRGVPTTWSIFRSSDAHILGVIVLDSSGNGAGSKDALSFDPLRPAFLGEGSHCSVLVLPKREGRPRNELKPYWPADPATRSYNPFRLRGEPVISASPRNQFEVGEVSPSTVMTSWPDILRVNALAVKR